ncbi:RNA polymerase III subunit C82 [Knufia fluminis]|uniref:DNA-directed RNA polymerase III subunit RPC3 n=1 Tax=Knufia fluminis TaxID=191047 RepID=A0AAN8EB72_9EURO|nr:RNA polymerase III subunit C82 [Knufia fluminis]
MTTSPAFQHLCCGLVEDYYGDFYRTIFETLAFGGRLSAPQVAQKCHLPLRQARSGLAGLVQLRLVHHHTPRDAQTIYSANLNRAYDVIRTGRLIEAAREQHGDTAAEIVATACDLGFATISELRDRILCEDEPAETVASLEQLIDDLLEDHYLIRLRKAHFGEAHDVRREVELNLLSPQAIAKLTGTKAKAEHALNVERGYDELVHTSRAENGLVNNDYVKQVREKQSNGVNGAATNGQLARLATLLQPNPHKIVALAQSTLVADLARKMHGKRAAAVLACAVRQTADPDVWSKLGPTHAYDVHVPQLRDGVNAEARKRSENEAKQVNGRVNGHSHHDDDEELADGDVDRELMFLTESAFHFLQGQSRQWYIEKGTFDDWVRKEETLRVMDSRLEPPAPRILRILIDKGKLEERTLQEIGLLGAKELRQCLSLLKQMGYLDLQEVPRNPQRMPNQTVFLWSHEAGRVQSLVLDSVYATIGKLVQLLKLEREKMAGTLAKTEREDVRGKEEEMLAPAEFTLLQRFRRTEAWIWDEIHRLDSTVAILRDS